MMFQEEILIDRVLKQLEAIYKPEIALINESRNNRDQLFHHLLDIRATSSARGIVALLPYYFILKHDFEMGWILFNYAGIAFGCIYDSYHVRAKQELVDPVELDIRPIPEDREMDQLLPDHGFTCFRIFGDYQPAPENLRQVGIDSPQIYDLSPQARYKTIERTKNYCLTYDTFNAVSRLLEIYFRREQYEQVEECLFRLRHMVSDRGKSRYNDPPVDVHKAGPWTNIYDYWYQARMESDPDRRKRLAWLALYWHFQFGVRLCEGEGVDGHVGSWVGCELIGEFELMDDKHLEFMRHLKRFTMHASISYCKKMIDSPIKIIPFAERNTPSYEEFQKMVNEKWDREG